jgi:hypothetical protein
VAGQVAGVLLAVEDPLAGELALVDLRANQRFKFAAHGVAVVDSAAAFLLAEGIAAELLLIELGLIALNLALGCSASAQLDNHNLAVGAASLMADLHALVATGHLLFAWHPAAGNQIAAARSLNL